MFKETGSGAKLDRAERRKVMALAQRREIDAVLVTELSRRGRSTLDLLHTLEELQAGAVSIDRAERLGLRSGDPALEPTLATILAGIAAFERELIQERIRSGMAAAEARGQRFSAASSASDRRTAWRRECWLSSRRAAATA